MKGTRTGKIARLPRPIRQELNRRLDEGEPGKKIVAWLNSRPEVQSVVAAEFNAKPIREQNISEWKKGGYRDWQAQQEAMEIAGRLGEDAAEWTGEGRSPLTDTLAHFLVARYAVATRRVAETGGREGWRMLREMCGDVVELRKGDHSAERLQIDHAWLELAKEKTEKQIRERIEELLKQPEMQKRFFGQGHSPGERERRMRAMFGLLPEEKSIVFAEELAPMLRELS